ncbi:MAG: alanine--tRNA ligase [Bacteroidota bacterium]
MTSKEIRQKFLDFFQEKEHQIVPSAPMVVKNDPTLMFTNAGMNQFKDFFLGNAVSQYPRIANTQKCLRVSGKHNDLEEVGHDTYHHTMFEMLGNWSFGNYFKEEAIAWGWELLTERFGIDKDCLYVTVFGGDTEDGLQKDHESYDFWKAFIAEDRILSGSKKDNFWEMGDSGPCGPCSEIHADIRSAEEKAKTPGHLLVNEGHPQVIEIWNLVFIEYNRLSNGTLMPLPAKHVDTGMGFERLCMVLQGRQSNYDTDVFQPLIQKLAKMAGMTYGQDVSSDIAMRVIADHLRAISFSIADGQLPSNVRAGYVIRRILRRAVRYGYSFLNFREPFINQLVPILVEQMGDIFTELKGQRDLIMKVIAEEESSFLRTLSTGILRFENYMNSHPDQKVMDGKFAFDLFDTYGFPIDLTQLMARENGVDVDMDGFQKGMEEQKSRSRHAAEVDTGDWVELIPIKETIFTGWDSIQEEIKISRYRQVNAKGKKSYQLVFDRTPFYGEAGGQVGDTGIIQTVHETIPIIDTVKENNLIIHIAEQLPEEPGRTFLALIDLEKRKSIARNHSATHLMHKALREVLGTHVEQKGSLVNSERLRFDFSHFQKVSDEEIREVERKVNRMIREDIERVEMRSVPMDEARNLGAMALFGEKYGETVRVIKFGDSLELCGGTHILSSGEIGLFKIVSEGAIAAGIRRIEAVSGEAAEQRVYDQEDIIDHLKQIFKGSKDLARSVTTLSDENSELRKQIQEMNRQKALGMKEELRGQLKEIKGVNFLACQVDLDTQGIKDLTFDLKATTENLFLVLGSNYDGKSNLTVAISDNLVETKGLDAVKIIRELAKDIQGGGGGQANYATAGGKRPEGLETALNKAIGFLEK